MEQHKQKKQVVLKKNNPTIMRFKHYKTFIQHVSDLGFHTVETTPRLSSLSYTAATLLYNKNTDRDVG